MKTLKTAALAACAGLALTACSNEDIITPQEQGTARMSVNITYADLSENTRTALAENGRDLDCTWTEGDQILVVNTENGSKLGVLNMVSGAGSSSARFDGNLTGITEGKHNYSFFYLGNKVDVNTTDVNAPLSYDFSTQTGKFEDLSDYDFLCATTEVNVADGFAYVEDMGLERKISFAHFTMNFPEGVPYTNQNITISGSNLYNALDLTFGAADGAGFSMDKKRGDIVVNQKDIYLVIVPNLEVPTNLTFSCQPYAQLYQATLGERQWKENEYVNLAEGEGVNVELAAQYIYEYHVNYTYKNPVTNENTTVQDVVKDKPATFEFTVGKYMNSGAAVAPEFDDYEFLGWYLENGTENLDGETYQLNKENNTVSFVAKYEHKSHDFTLIVVNYDGSKGTITQTAKADQSVFYMDDVTADDGPQGVFVKPGNNYEFLGWSLSNSQSGPFVDTVTVTKADNYTKTVYAIWKKKDIGGGTPAAGGSDY